MNGLEATKEIRRLEAVNGIGVFSGSPVDVIQEGKATDGDALEKELFKSPVIIVALTASSLQSDRHEALAAGCNDFLTKVSHFQPYTLREMPANRFRLQPVNFVWLERKLLECVCMQSLIVFDVWSHGHEFYTK